MRIAVLATTGSWYFADLRRAAADRHELIALPFQAISSTVACCHPSSNNEQFPVLHDEPTPRSGEDRRSHAERGNEARVLARGADLSAFDAVLVRTMPPGSLEQVVFRMDALGRLAAAGTTVINPPRAIECAVDKYLTTARLAEAGLPVPKTIVCQTVEQGLAAFEDLGGDAVIKPLFGSEGRGIARLNDGALAERALRLLVGLDSVVYLQEFVPHAGFDLRLLLIGRQILAIRRSNPLDWRTNVSRGATAEAIEPTDECVELAHRAAAVVGASLAGVDLVVSGDGRTYVIEVNAVPGWRAVAAAHDRDVAAMVLNHVAELVHVG
jgi:ribosomal protein S6--L-glutamate ligase